MREKPGHLQEPTPYDTHRSTPPRQPTLREQSENGGEEDEIDRRGPAKLMDRSSKY